MSKINETNYPRRTQANYEDTDMLVIQKAGGNTYTTRIEDLREDCQETLAPALDTMRENLATIEGSTASKAYAKGDYLVFGGRLCKAKTSIAVNATLILDTNIELSPVGDELSSISSDLANIIKVKNISHLYTIDGAGGCHWNPTSDTGFNETGYTPLGIIGYISDTTTTYFTSIWSESTSWSMMMHGTPNATGTVQYTVLYLKNLTS